MICSLGKMKVCSICQSCGVNTPTDMRSLTTELRREECGCFREPAGAGSWENDSLERRGGVGTRTRVTWLPAPGSACWPQLQGRPRPFSKDFLVSCQ